MKIIDAPDNIDSDGKYVVGILGEKIDEAVGGQVDKVFIFSAGMSAVTPEKLIADSYRKLSTGEIKSGDKLDLKKDIE